MCDVIIFANCINIVRQENEDENEKEQENEEHDNGEAGGKEDSRKMRMVGGWEGGWDALAANRARASSMYDPLIDFIASESHTHPFVLLLTCPLPPPGQRVRNSEVKGKEGRKDGWRKGGRERHR